MNLRRFTTLTTAALVALGGSLTLTPVAHAADQTVAELAQQCRAQAGATAVNVDQRCDLLAPRVHRGADPVTIFRCVNTPPPSWSDCVTAQRVQHRAALAVAKKRAVVAEQRAAVEAERAAAAARRGAEQALLDRIDIAERESARQQKMLDEARARAQAQADAAREQARRASEIAQQQRERQQIQFQIYMPNWSWN